VDGGRARESGGRVYNGIVTHSHINVPVSCTFFNDANTGDFVLDSASCVLDAAISANAIFIFNSTITVIGNQALSSSANVAINGSSNITGSAGTFTNKTQKTKKILCFF
jgi:hypothetical protein